jgi:hypothetical protein
MKTTIVDGRANWPKPNPRYAQLAATWRVAGLDIKDNEFEKIDAILTGEKWDDPERRKRASRDYDADPTDLLSAEALCDSGYMSQDTASYDPLNLIDGYLPRTRPFLMN